MLRIAPTTKRPVIKDTITITTRKPVCLSHASWRRIYTNSMKQSKLSKDEAQILFAYYR